MMDFRSDRKRIIESDDSVDSLVDHAVAEFLEAEDAGRPLDVDAWLGRYASIQGELREFLNDQRQTGKQLSGDSGGDSRSTYDLEQTTDFGSISSSKSQDTPTIRSGKLGSETGSIPKIIGGIRLGRLLGSGGMGRVYEGVDASGDSVAVKLLSPDWSRSPESIDRFRQEGAIASSINHPRCVFVRMAETDNGCPYIVMELMSGATLKDLVKQRGPLPYQESLRLIADVAEGLEEAHSHGMIHRDVKPANCYLEASGRVKVGDFGLARSMMRESDLTTTGGFVGTPLYASPEQIRGADLDERTDIYSLCATLYYLLAGQAPFESGNPTQTIARIVSEDPKSVRELVPNVPSAVERLLEKGLARDVTKRFQNMGELRAALASLLDTKSLAVAYGKRLGAIAIDLGIYSLCSTVVIFSLIPEVILRDVKNPYVIFGNLPIWFTYLFLQDWLRGGTIGKRLFRIVVVDEQTLDQPGWKKIFIRTAVYMALSGYGTDILLEIFDFNRNTLVCYLAHAIGYTVGPMLMLVSFRLRPDHPLLQDWLSGTKVIERPAIESSTNRMPKLNSEPLANLPATSLPAKFGRFQVQGLLCEQVDDCPSVYLAEDTGLERQVWIVAKKAEHGTTIQTRIGKSPIDRTTRLRHIQQGEGPSGNWDAYLALDGAPIEHWVSNSGPLSWSITRSLMLQFCDEMIASKDVNSTPSLHSKNQIWVTQRGRLVLLDFPLPEDPQASEPMNWRETLRYLATACLMGKVGPQRNEQLADHRMADIIARPLPIRAKQIICELDHPNTELDSLEKFADSLRAYDNQAESVGIRHRLIQVFLMFMLLAPVFGATCSLSRVGNQIGAVEAADAMALAETGRRIAEDSTLYDQWKRQLQEGGETDEIPMPEQLKGFASKVYEKNQQGYKLRHEGSGVVQHMMFEQNGLTEGLGEELKTMDLRLPTGESSKYLLGPEVGFKGGFDFEAAEIATLANPELAPKIGEVKRIWFVLLMATMSITGLFLWDVIFRGGWSAWFAGIRYVDRRGRKASFLRFAFRALITWMPLFVLGSIVAFLDALRPDLGTLNGYVAGVYMALPILIVIPTLLWPKRTLQDLLAGTHPVPR